MAGAATYIQQARKMKTKVNPQNYVRKQRMATLLTAVKSVLTQKEDETSDSLLTAVKSTDTRTKDSTQEASSNQHDYQKDVDKLERSTKSPEEALQILRSQPDLDQLTATLRQLNSSEDFFPGSGAPFNLHAPGPLQAQIIHTILNTIIPDFWPVLKEPQRSDLVSCLQNVAGLNAVVARLRLLSTQGGYHGHEAARGVVDLLDVAESLFTGSETISGVWHHLQNAVDDAVRREMSWKEFVALVGSGKVTAVVAQAEDAIKGTARGSWLAKGGEYAAWLGKNIAGIVISDSSSQDAIAAAAQMFAKALNLGYSSELLQGWFVRLVLEEIRILDSQNVKFTAFSKQMPAHTKRTFTEHLLRWLSSLGSSTDGNESQQQSEEVSAIAGFLTTVIQDDTVKQHMLSFLADPTLSSSTSLAAHRACLAALSYQGDDEVHSFLDRAMSTFSNSLFINHSPVLQQESLAQTLLLAAGYVHRRMPMALLMIARSSSHMQGVSNRLESSNPRARWLGMVFGTAVSSLVDKEGSRMSFGTNEMETKEARWYRGLVKVEDMVGTLNDFAALLEAVEKASKLRKRPSRQTKADKLPKLDGKPVFGPPRPPVQTEVVGEKVTEILDDESEEDEDELKPYAKPDSDPEDSDEDATLVNRNKARPPVYIRDLMSMLRDDKNHDRFQLGIKHAATLIRRKANFGAEVKDHIEELAVIFCNLQDPFETKNFEELKLQGLIAILLSDVKTIAPCVCRQAFTGDYSIAQRCTVLSALGLGGRELAGFKNEDELNPALDNANFPSRRLPPHLHSAYSVPASSTKRLEAASRDMEHTLIKPLALQAADQSTGHLNAVKVRTFSSRMDVERTKRKPAPNQLAKIFGEAFFFPLASRYQQEIAAYGSASVFASMPVVLVTFLKTLALLLNASGPATFGLPQISGDFWDLLLSLRVQAVTDITVLQAVLFALLTLLEVNEDKRRIAEEYPKQLMETQRWVDLVFERTGGNELVSENGNEDEVKVRTLAAGVLVKTKEVVEAYQKQLVGYGFD